MHLIAAEYRRQAMRCAAEADKAPSPEQRERLMKMRQAFLTLAENEDWLNGRRRPETIAPRAQSLAG
jgi:hypothetical protein